MSSNSHEDYDPSWSEVQNFITFLSAQLYDCEKSVFCNLGKDSFRGFKQFIVQFSIVMAKVLHCSIQLICQLHECISYYIFYAGIHRTNNEYKQMEYRRYIIKFGRAL